ncbi:GntR family transcriptional regulator [Parasediminibacterium sp. JCM 36343]|uniref:GntR family transcriptional regulator n=1 Tax=Parasediminibacterium sp. JCM 36343 TaxID=3374279 RepID=UPI003978DC0C
MIPKNFFKYIDINYYSSTPKYLQLANAIVKAIKEGKLNEGDTMPSINELSFEFEISRDTAEKGYRHLKKIGALGSVPGKGYFIKDAEIDNPLKILMLFNKLSPHKKIIYDTFVANIGETAAIDFFVYNNDFTFFKKLLSSRIDQYTHYVMMPHFGEAGENVHEIINTVPKNKLVVIDKLVPGITGRFAAIYQNFEKDIYHALEQALEQLGRYHTLKIVSPEYANFPKEQIVGFLNFCHQYAFNYVVVNHLHDEPINAGEVFITLMENDLVELIEKILTTPLQVGKDVGVISYNESAVKKVILNGITTISTDFYLMGKRAAEMILEKTIEHEEMPFYLRLRSSL